MARPLLPSALLTQGPVVAGFSTRGPGDSVETLAAAAPFDASRLFMVTQIHGRTVVTVGSDSDPQRIRPIEADALVTAAPGTTLAVRTADCAAVLLSDPARRAIGVAHAGWRGLVAGVIGAAVDALAAVGGRPGSLVAAVGPAIGPCCFEVGEEVAEEISRAVGAGEVVLRRPGAPRPFVDLRRAAVLRLAAAGVGEDRVEVVGPCTRCSPELLHSYRREGPAAGRQLGLVSLGPS